eukprot:TRINITY_DN17741_c0_g4_i1.p1 TRINITY_DN17741_c0_g4~~TRINITY_DN17741_c0_g4_i1.p1  ORF type:complete len:795 (+),score=253.13 TRINITY_DN17741_c0_g4_i1:33-2417(+)
MPPLVRERDTDREAIRKSRSDGLTYLGVDIGRSTCAISVWEDGSVRTLAGFQHTDPTVPCFSMKHGSLVGHAAYKQWKHHASDDSMLGSPLNYFATGSTDLARLDAYATPPAPNKPGKKEAKTALENLLNMLLSIATEEHRCGSLETCHMFVTTPSWMSPENEVVYVSMLNEVAVKAGIAALSTVPQHESAVLASHLRQERQLTKLWLSERVLIIDVGLGASITLCELNGGDHTVLYSDTDSSIGGAELDRLIYGFFVTQLRKQKGLPPAADASFLTSADQVILLQNCRELREGLSGGQKQTVDMTGFAGIPDFSLTMSRAMMEMTCISVWKALRKFVEQVLVAKPGAAAPAAPGGGAPSDGTASPQPLDSPTSDVSSVFGGVAKSSINEVVLIGGCAKAPKIQQEVQRIFSNHTPVPTVASSAGPGKKSVGALRLKARIAGKTFIGGEPPPMSPTGSLKPADPPSPSGASSGSSPSGGGATPVYIPAKPDQQLCEGAALACHHAYRRRPETASPTPASPTSFDKTTSTWGSPVCDRTPSQSPTNLGSTTKSLTSALTFLSDGIPSTIGVAVTGNKMCPILKKFAELGPDGTLTKGVVLGLRTPQRVQIDVLQGERRKATDNTLLSSFYVYLMDATKMGSRHAQQEEEVYKRICVQFTYSTASLLVDVWVQGASHISEKKIITRELYTVIGGDKRTCIETKFLPSLPTYQSTLSEGFVRYDAPQDQEDSELNHRRQRMREKIKAQQAHFERYRTRLETEQRRNRDELIAMEGRIRNKMIEHFDERYLLACMQVR